MSSANWWANKLGQAPAPTSYPPVNNPNQAPAPVNPYMPGAVQFMPPQYSGQPTEQSTQAWQANMVPESSQQNTTCPSCRGNNYATVGTQVTANGTVEAKRCFNCGYPKVQAGSGVGTVGNAGSGPARPARQVPTGGWNPGVIVAKL